MRRIPTTGAGRREQGSLLLDFLQAAIIFGAITTVFFTAFQSKWVLLTESIHRTVAQTTATSRLDAFRIRPGDEWKEESGDWEIGAWKTIESFKVPELLPPEIGVKHGELRVRPRNDGLWEVEVQIRWRSTDNYVNDYHLTTLVGEDR